MKVIETLQKSLNNVGAHGVWVLVRHLEEAA